MEKVTVLKSFDFLIVGPIIFPPTLDIYPENPDPKVFELSTSNLSPTL